MLRQQQLKEKIRLLDAYSPLKILGRGYGLIASERAFSPFYPGSQCQRGAADPAA